MKKCSKCKKEKSRDNFYKRSRNHEGLNSVCKKCSQARCKKQYKDNSEKMKARKKKWRENNPEKSKASTKKYRKNNPEKVKESERRYYKSNPGKRSEKSRKWREANPERAKYHIRKRRAMKLAVNENYTAIDALITFKAFDNKCYNCKSIDKLCIDHHRPLSKRNPLTLSNAVILCNLCNCSKGAKNPEEFYGIKKCSELDNLLFIIGVMY